MWPWIIGIAVGLLAVVAVAAIPLARAMEQRELRKALQLFRLRREMLEARFFDVAKTIGKPRGLRWVECDWLHAVTFARDRESRLVTAFVSVNIRFEAVEGGDMEDVAAVSTVREGSAVFHYRNGAWGTGGRALFNMTPADAITQLSSQFEPLPVIFPTRAPVAKSGVPPQS
jgi:hypothetical protein